MLLEINRSSSSSSSKIAIKINVSFSILHDTYRFENDKDGTEDPPRTTTSAPPGGRRRSSPSSRLGEMLLEDKRDWLDMAVDDHNQAGTDEPDGQPRPQSAGGQPHSTSGGDHSISFNPFVLPNLEPKCAPGDPILYPETIFCYSP